jgi:hypothetical protein
MLGRLRCFLQALLPGSLSHFWGLPATFFLPLLAMHPLLLFYEFFTLPTFRTNW